MADRSPKTTVQQPSYIKESLKKMRLFTKLKWTLAGLLVYLSFCEHHLLYQEPFLPSWTPENNLVGVWRFSPFYSLKSLDPEDFEQFKLILDNNQTFRIVGIPDAMVGYTENKIDDAPRRSIKDDTVRPKKIWILSSRPIDDQTVIEGEWSVVNGESISSPEDEWIDLTAPGYNFEPWFTVESGLFSRGTPSELDFRYDGVMLCKERPPQR